jgi:hypothetical protein
VDDASNSGRDFLGSYLLFIDFRLFVSSFGVSPLAFFSVVLNSSLSYSFSRFLLLLLFLFHSSFFLSSPRQVEHDFASGVNLKVPVVVHAMNTQQTPVTFAFETLLPEEEFNESKRAFRPVTSANTRGRYMWAGGTKSKVTGLPSLHVVALSLSAVFYQPGDYSLNR